MVKVVVNQLFNPWIVKEMSGYDTIVDMGAGSFNHLEYLVAPVKIGIEIFQWNIDNAVFKDCLMFNGNFIHYRDIIRDFWKGRKAVMFIDSIEHIPMDAAVKLISELKEDGVDKICIFTPRGYCYQDTDPTKMNNDAQIHRSFWFDADLERIGMTEILVDEQYHRFNHQHPDKGCYFAKYEKK
jgi:hypothetical protein